MGQSQSVEPVHTMPCPIKKTLPRDPEALRLRVGCIGAMSDAEVQSLVKMLDEVGAAVLTPDREDDELATYQTLDRLLGQHVWHDAENKHGIVELNPEKPTSINVADTEHPHQPHTDDAYTEKPALFMTLNCRVAANNGGESVLVSGADFLEHLSSEDLETLKKPGMVTMGRRPATAEPNAPWKFTSSIPMFWVDEDSKRLCLRWRCKDKCVKEVAPEAVEAYERLNEIALDDNKRLLVPLQPTEVLVLDNFAHAHGRTSYPKGEARVLWRKNYFGDGQLARSIRSGMVDSEALAAEDEFLRAKERAKSDVVSTPASTAASTPSGLSHESFPDLISDHESDEETNSEEAPDDTADAKRVAVETPAVQMKEPWIGA